MSIDPGQGGAEEPRTSDRLQSMLAQAVEGQQSEQRELIGALTDIRNQMQRLGQDIAEMRAGGQDGPGADPAAINNVTVELREAVRFLSERLDGVTRMVAQRGEELADVRTALSAVDAHVRSQTETIGVLSQGLQALPSYGERVSALHDAIGAVHGRLAALEASVAQSGDTSGIDARLVAIEAAVQPLGHDVALSRQAGTDHAASLADQSARIAEQAQALQEQRSSLEALHERVAEIATGTQAALAVPPVFDASAISGLEAKLSAIADQLAGLTDRDSSSGADQESFAAAVREAEARLRTHVDDAVLALAEILVRRRPVATAEQITGTPVAPPSSSSYQPVAGYGAPQASILPEEDESEVSTPIVDFSVAEFADEDTDEADAATEEDTADVDGDADVADEADLADDEDDYDDEYGDEDEDDYDEQAGLDEPPAEAAADEVSGEAEEGDEPYRYFTELHDDEAAAEGDAADDDGGDAADDLDATSEIHFPRPAVLPSADQTPMPPSPSPAWSPEVPPERPEGETAVPTVVPEGRKRRWFSR